jgi:hypothetical protein
MIRLFISFYLVWLFSVTFALAYNDKITHPNLSENALLESNTRGNNYLSKNLMLKDKENSLINGKTLIEWLQYGAEMEDDPMCRASNHFHNPYLDWTDSGLSDTLPLVDWWCWSTSPYPPEEIKSNVTWATGYSDRGYIDPFSDVSDVNAWDWESARNYFYTYLTGLDAQNGLQVAPDETTRNLYLVDTLRALGQVMHLVQDTAVPAHVRDDFSQGHTRYLPDHEFTMNPLKWFGNLFEDYVRFKEGAAWFDSAPVGGNFMSFRITDLWDTNILRSDTTPEQLSQVSMSSLGLAEYTSMNFLSMFTLFETNGPDGPLLFPYPKPEHCVIRLEKPQNVLTSLDRQYLASWNGHPGEIVDKLAVVSYLKHYRDAYFPDISNEKLPIGLDEGCFEDYAAKLIPRAIGYSAALLDYFFRGTIEITAPEDFVYSVIDGSATDQKFEYIKANLRNTTLDEEEMVDGTLVAVARYKRMITYSPDYTGGNEPRDPQSRESEYAYSVSAQNTTLLQTSAPTEVTFDFTADAIPAGVTDLSLQVVFLGTLGNETDTAVAVGMVDLTEPTHFTFFNSTDEMPENGTLVGSGGGGLRDFIVAFTGTDPDSADGATDNMANFGFYETYDPLMVVEDLAPASYFRIVALLDSRQGAYMVMDTGDSAGCPPIWTFQSSNGAMYQEDTEGSYEPVIQLKPKYCDTDQAFTHRGIWQHHYFYQYLCNGSDCSYLLAQRSDISANAPVSLSGKINFPNQVINYSPQTCAESGGDFGTKMGTKPCFP